MVQQVDPPAPGAARPGRSDLRSAHELFVATGRLPTPSVRRLVADSWRRSRRGGVDPSTPAVPHDLSGPELASLRREHPLAAALPAIRHLLVQPAEGWVTALTDHSGRLLWVEGDPGVRRQVERIGFVEGAVWREDCAGTNAPGTALATGRPVRVLGPEHWARAVQSWNCVAAPVHDPAGRLLGVLDITGGPVVASELATALVRATVAAVEATLAAAPPAPGSAAAGADEPWLRVLGASRPTLRLPHGSPVELTRRHAEILLLLAEHPAGLSADELAVQLSDEDLSDVTVRAEVSRLRRLVGPLLSQSRPYRLTRVVRTDVDAVRRALALGDLELALAGYPGPVLPRSSAPGVERVRDDLAARVRGEVLAGDDPEVLVRWAATDEGADDWEVWQALVTCTAPGSARHLWAASRLVGLEQRLA